MIKIQKQKINKILIGGEKYVTDTVNGTIYKQRKEKQMLQEEKYLQNQEENY